MPSLQRISCFLFKKEKELDNNKVEPWHRLHRSLTKDCINMKTDSITEIRWRRRRTKEITFGTVCFASKLKDEEQSQRATKEFIDDLRKWHRCALFYGHRIIWWKWCIECTLPMLMENVFEPSERNSNSTAWQIRERLCARETEREFLCNNIEGTHAVPLKSFRFSFESRAHTHAPYKAHYLFSTQLFVIFNSLKLFSFCSLLFPPTSKQD